MQPRSTLLLILPEEEQQQRTEGSCCWEGKVGFEWCGGKDSGWDCSSSIHGDGSEDRRGWMGCERERGTRKGKEVSFEALFLSFLSRLDPSGKEHTLTR